MKFFISASALLFSVNLFAAPVNVNTADAQTIAESLSGIGLKKAEAIIKYRQENGPFKAAQDLANVSGIGEKTVQKNLTDILVADSSAQAPAPATASTTADPAANKAKK